MASDVNDADNLAVESWAAAVGLRSTDLARVTGHNKLSRAIQRGQRADAGNLTVRAVRGT